MKNYSMTYVGIIVMILGTYLVDSLGFTEMCATEITEKATQYAPLIIGGIMAFIGRYRIGDLTRLGVRK